MKLQWRRRKRTMDGSTLHQLEEIKGGMAKVVATVVLTGRRGVDDYPYDWYFEELGRGAGVSDTLRSAKSTVEYTYRLNTEQGG